MRVRHLPIECQTGAELKDAGGTGTCFRRVSSAKGVAVHRQARTNRVEAAAISIRAGIMLDVLVPASHKREVWCQMDTWWQDGNQSAHLVSSSLRESRFCCFGRHLEGAGRRLRPSDGQDVMQVLRL